ncbi:nucleolin [Brachypodium distachyon]|uniref:Uncharacterized protein n=1 Tax=Brachypodium distachyon TaxID=15368 RepID=I1I830_BRADI|nr:nucleolin [Brachypodium distachyon]KQJ98747.1 hypothetical protein BRADI_3g38820v3 [Brachypodium distachyon]|eukprot:XP_003574674.1 nucleolin [Brachypodium distachyon]
MESSHITGDDGEGCNSSESGWTMYLSSPMQGDDDDGNGGGKGSGSDGSNVDDGYGYTYIVHGRKGGKEYQDDGDDNDSLASDASTGPAKVKSPPCLPNANGKEDHPSPRRATDEDRKEEDDDEEEDDGRRSRFSTSSRKKAGKVEKGGGGDAKSSSKRGHGKRGSSSRTSFFW